MIEKEEFRSIVQEVFDSKMKDFYVEREQHYLDHQFICGVRAFSDRVKGQACKTVTNGGIVGLGTLLLYGFYWFVFHLGDKK